MTETLLLDNSAWVRLGDPALAAGRAHEIADALEAGRIAACPPFLLEAGYAARRAKQRDQLLASPIDTTPASFTTTTNTT